MVQYEILEVNLGKNEYICFDLFEVCFLVFSSKEETMRNIHNRNAAELAYCIIFFLMQEICTYFVNTRILVWSLFSRGPLKPSLSHFLYSQIGNHLQSNWQLSCAVLLNGIAHKRYINFI